MVKRMSQKTAREIMDSIECDYRADYFTLNNSQVLALLDYAKELKYRKPHNANGSKARCFFAYVQRSNSENNKNF